MNELIKDQKDELIIKLLHYFITEHNYNPVVLHGAQDEIWLEKLDGDYKIIRIASNYIHNNEQLNYDMFKTSRIMDDISKKTFVHNINSLNIFLNLGDNVNLDSTNNITCIEIKDIKDLSKYEVINETFPNIVDKMNFKEKGVDLLYKLTSEISKKNEIDAKKAEEIFKPKIPIVTYIIMFINLAVFIAMYLLGNGSNDKYTLIKFGASVPSLIKAGEYWRLIASSFIHIGVVHFLFNNYALYVIGAQLESFYGKTKYIIIYLFSAITSGLLSLMFVNAISAGASGAIFGLLGALLYFGYHYRIYLGTVIKSQIIPLILFNLLLGFTLTGINNAAHIGGLIGGILISVALGVKYKSTKGEKINGWIMTIIFTTFLIYMSFIGI